ncbi:esterase B1 [Apis mellifera]|uniref:Carboxylic ester hydrolase n=1 Tax=Apis mellifera TaxID=7460 RepID=A0A7M7SRJ5_APIME|nr:esterase B1 [Apis mellifera]|eukprot:XP_026300495.1 esterase B1 [Apis mellifera]
MKDCFVLALLISTFPYEITNSLKTPVVRTPSGPVRGLILRTVWHSIKYSSFKGIPYAKPPLGDLRFKPPVPIDPWKRVLHAYEEGSVCAQWDYLSLVYMGREDCLFLNVFTQEVEFKKGMNLRPVMVWIHGGGYFSGYGNSSLYGPDFFLEEDVVLVSFNYRLGVLGFLALKHPNATGNAGLKDQRLVFQWVQNNIAAFGGDPNRVTIFGESAGSTSVGFHILSERSKGLFLRSISMSGTPLCPWAYHSPEEMIRNAHQLAAVLGYVPKNHDDLVNYLRQAPLMELVSASTKVEMNLLPFRPTIEDPDIDPSNSSVITECPITKYHNGDLYRHDVMLGYTHDEVFFFFGPPIGVANTINWAKKYLQNAARMSKDIDEEPRQALLARVVNDLVKASFKQVKKIGMDVFFSGPIDLTQRFLARHNKGHPVYYYQLSYQSKYAMHKFKGNPLNGTAHFDDVGYIFNSKSIRAPSNPKSSFNRFRKKMVTLWANFAKYGNPTPKNFSFDVKWIKSEKEGFQLDINTISTMHKRLIDKKTEYVEKLLYKLFPLITSCVKKPANFTDLF